MLGVEFEPIPTPTAEQWSKLIGVNHDLIEDSAFTDLANNSEGDVHNSTI